MRVLVQIGLVALGSVLGGLTRWGVSLSLARLLGGPFPWGTLIINISGSLFLGWAIASLRHDEPPGYLSWLGPDDMHLLLAVGFTGSYTTFSAFEYEAQKLLHEEDIWVGLAYLVASVLLGLIAVRLGIVLGRWR